MKRRMTLALGLCWMIWQGSGCATGRPHEQLGWYTDLPAAQAKAKAEGKLIFMDFEGSDWCMGCMELNRDVFPTKQFATYARTNLVLMSVDFPEGRDLPPALKKANDALADKYKVDGFPVMLLLDADGRELGRLDYVPGEKPEELIAQLKKLKKS